MNCGPAACRPGDQEVEGLDYGAIAAILELRPAAVRLLVHRAREATRRTLLKKVARYVWVIYELSHRTVLHSASTRRELPPARQSRLASHLLSCPTCRQIERQLATMQAGLRRMGEPMATSPGAVEFRSPRSSSRLYFAALTGIAAVLVAAVGLWLATERLQVRPDLASGLAHDAQPGTRTMVVERAPAPPVVRVSVKSTADKLVVPMTTKDPDVSIFWIYPTVKTVEAPPPTEQPSAS